MSNYRGNNDAIERVDEKSSPLSPASSQQQPQRKQQNVGILSIAAYFPKTYVSQEDLEVYDKVAAGKYTKGLMQDKMGFCTDLEDINSIALTVTKQLIEQSGVSLNDIGYLEVGTETIVDKSKSVKTVLMELFEESGNSDIEGVDTTNACYGGTAALFHAIDHCNSPFWDGRFAIVVAADIAVYDKGNARPTGGCGAIAMLIGPNAPLVLDPIRATHMAHIYDFYKPDPFSEYPTVDGKLSLQAYITAVDKCYETYRRKYNVGQQQSIIDKFDGILMHSPYCKLVRKAFARLLYNEFNVICKSSPTETSGDVQPIAERYKGFQQIPENLQKMDYEYWMKEVDKTSLEKVAIQLSEQLYQDKTGESLFLSNQVGNMYTASLYSCLVSYLTSKPVEKLINKKVLFFSYGSGSAASMFSATLASDVQAIKKLLVGIEDVRIKLLDRIKVTPEEFSAHLEHRKMTFSQANRSPTGQPTEASDSNGVGPVSVDGYLYSGAYYLRSVDGMFRRKYARHELVGIVENNNNEEAASCILAKKLINANQESSQVII